MESPSTPLTIDSVKLTHEYG